MKSDKMKFLLASWPMDWPPLSSVWFVDGEQSPQSFPCLRDHLQRETPAPLASVESQAGQPSPHHHAGRAVRVAEAPSLPGDLWEPAGGRRGPAGCHRLRLFPLTPARLEMGKRRFVFFYSVCVLLNRGDKFVCVSERRDREKGNGACIFLHMEPQRTRHCSGWTWENLR